MQDLPNSSQWCYDEVIILQWKDVIIVAEITLITYIHSYVHFIHCWRHLNVNQNLKFLVSWFSSHLFVFVFLKYAQEISNVSRFNSKSSAKIQRLNLFHKKIFSRWDNELSIVEASWAPDYRKYIIRILRISFFVIFQKVMRRC